MKKLKSSGGFTLMEVLASMLILTFLVVGMGPGMKTAMTVYQESTFQSSSTALIGTMNATLGDVLRYAEDVELLDKVEDDKYTFTFTNTDYGLQNAQFMCWTTEDTGDTEPTVVTVIDHNGKKQPLLPEGSYPNMEITAFSATYEDGLFNVTYTIKSTVVQDMERDASCTIALLNN